jgi:SWI/SNF-related matrix-associated actin-dependent regulator 1 of chromatin subfamily A
MNANHIRKTDRGFVINFRYNPRLVDAVKLIDGRSWNDKLKCWTAPFFSVDQVTAFANKYEFEIVDESTGNSPYDFSNIEYPKMPEYRGSSTFRRTPFPYQLEGVQYICDNKRVIVGDQMGLGKTGQSIMAITEVNAFPCLIICPATLRENWRREWTIWTDKRARVLDDSIKNRWEFLIDRGQYDVFIVNYESLQKYFVEERKQKDEGEKLTLKDFKFKSGIDKFQSVIIDESHRCKNNATIQTKLTKGICKDKEYILALTGTPVINKPDDLISQLAIIDHLNTLGGYKAFKAMYCDKPITGALEHLNAQLRRNCFFRREKHEVLTQLPSKTRQIVYCEINNRQEYKEAEMDLADYLKKYRQKTDEEVQKSLRGELMVKMQALKNISANGKLETAFEYIDEVMEAGEKLIVFAHLHEVINKIVAKYPKCVTVTGNDAHEQRDANVDRFQTDPECRLIVCSIMAAGVGITLTAASRVAFVEFAWHAAIHDQAEDRAHRIGAKDNVQCTYFVGKDTIDEHIYGIIEEKRSMSNSAVGAIDVTTVDILGDAARLFDENFGKSNDSNNSTLF